MGLGSYLYVHAQGKYFRLDCSNTEQVIVHAVLTPTQSSRTRRVVDNSSAGSQGVSPMLSFPLAKQYKPSKCNRLLGRARPPSHKRQPSPPRSHSIPPIPSTITLIPFFLSTSLPNPLSLLLQPLDEENSLWHSDFTQLGLHSFSPGEDNVTRSL